jgi:hypothetical protein
MIQQPDRSTSASWARFRFSVVGLLLSSPPARGELKAALRALADKTWTHPVSGREVRFAAVTIERWYYTAQRARDDPVGVLRRAVRRDCGKATLPPVLAEHLRKQHQDHPHWSYQLHYDNLAARVKADPALGPLRSYVTVRRYMQAHGLVRKPRSAPHSRPGEARAEKRREQREIRSYEAEYVGSLWHLDFHHGSLKVLTSRGRWQRPIALGGQDDEGGLLGGRVRTHRLEQAEPIHLRHVEVRDHQVMRLLGHDLGALHTIAGGGDLLEAQLRECVAQQ